ncbi:MAG: hypothetical protein ACR2GX_01015 [Candidatus Dormibacteria bacterium]
MPSASNRASKSWAPSGEQIVIRRDGHHAITLTASALLHRYRIVLVTVRTFLGIVYLSNGLAKLFSFHSLTIGPWKSYFIDGTDALGIQR